MLNIYSLDNIDEYSDNSIIMVNPSYYTKGFFNGNGPSYFKDNGNYDSIPLCLIDMSEAFDLIHEVGKTVAKYIFECSLYKDKRDLYDIIVDIVNDTAPSCLNKYKKWINDNVYPYSLNSYLEKENLNIANFMYDCALLNIYNEINIWILKYTDNNDISDRLYKLLNILNLPEKLVYEYDISLKDIERIIPTSKDKKNHTKNIPIFNNLRKLLLKLIVDKTNNFEYQITKQTPFYNNKKDIYHLYNKANSIIGIAYYKLLLNVTSYRNQKICKNPSCINFVYVKKNTRYCDECRNNGIPEMLKHRRYENSDKGKKQRQKHYIERKEKAAIKCY